MEDIEVTTNNYMKEYNEFIYEAVEKMEKLTGEDLQMVAKEFKETAPGMDQWAPAHLKLLSNKAFEALAMILNTITDGAPWPENMIKTRAAFLPKGERDPLDPTAYRVLFILPSVNRF